ncbi:MAG: FAD binding domain-containing protein [Methylobacteriaceae bacterium]|nr:FAD binding domain-containing protein [Methylobacteriaceae bacterium]
MTRVETYPTLAEAARALGEAAYMAGGTLVMRDVNAGTAPPRLVRAADPELTAISAAGDSIRLGAGVTMAQILARPELDFLHEAARRIGGPQIRNMATVGGNLFAPHPYGDLAVALIALGGRAILAGQGTRPVEQIVRERERPPLVAAIEIARPRPGAFGFAKVARVKPKGASVLALAVLAPREGSTLRGVRVALGAMGDHPLRSAGAERALEGRPFDAEAIARAARQVAEGLDPPTDSLATGWYRREVAGVHLARLLESLRGGRA